MTVSDRGEHRLPALAHQDVPVPLCDGGETRYVNLDNAASTPPLRAVVDAVDAAVPWYSSVHRGAGYLSRVSTALYERSRERIGSFVGAHPDDAVVIVRNTTDAINHLARCLRLRPGDTVLTTAIEHHANLLPWRRVAPVVHIEPPASAEALLAGVEAELRASGRRIGVVAVTGASNVTGEVFPIAELATLAHAHGALLCVDAAQLAPHRAIDMAADGIDCLAFSGHKLYAPYGAGALIAPAGMLADAEPLLAGGGAVDFVGLDSVLWTALPDRLEAGSPNVLGAVALAAACDTLTATGMETIASHERALLEMLESGLAGMSGITRHVLWEGGCDRVGLCTVTIQGMDHALVAAALSAEWGIGVRHGCFCAHPYITHLLGIDEAEADSVRRRIRRGERADIPGAVRASLGIGTTEDDVRRFIEAIGSLMAEGPRLHYVQDPDTGDFEPEGGDLRPAPAGLGLSGGPLPGHAAGCGRL